MNCLCNLFDNNCIWIIIIAILLLSCCGNNGCSYGNYNNNGCGCN